MSVRDDGIGVVGSRDADSNPLRSSSLPHEGEGNGLFSLGTAALIGWEWLQRQIDIFATFEVMHYRPKERPNAVRVIHKRPKRKIGFPRLMSP